MKKLLTVISILFFFSCNQEEVHPCGTWFMYDYDYLIVEEIDGCIGVEGRCYYQGDLDVLDEMNNDCGYGYFLGEDNYLGIGEEKLDWKDGFFRKDIGHKVISE